MLTRGKGPSEVNEWETTLNGNGNLILNKKQGENFYFCSKNWGDVGTGR